MHNPKHRKRLKELAIEEYGMTLEELLKHMYWNKSMNQYQIANELRCNVSAVCQWMDKFVIEKRPNIGSKGMKRSPEECARISQMHKGKVLSSDTRKLISEARKGISYIGKSPHFTGKRRRSDKYVQVYKPDHPFRSSEGYVMEHRLVMENVIGRYLSPEEEVHHINEIRNDNSPENLHLFASKKEHMSYHMKKRHEQRRQKHVN